MSNLAKNQLDFQVYNQQLNGPRSPIDMNTLKTNADTEQKKQAALGKVFDAKSASYVEREQIYEAGSNLPTPIKPVEEVVATVTTSDDESTALGKRKQGPITDFDKSTYEVYTTSPVADAWGKKTTRVVYMGREHYNCAKDARDVADLLRAKGMETFVFRCNRTPVKNRKRVKGPPRTKKPAAPKQNLKSICEANAQWQDGNPLTMGIWKVMPDGLNAKGKQKVWFVHNNLTFKRDTTAEAIRSAAVCIKQCQAWEAVKALEEGSGLGAFIEDLPFHCNGETDKSKVRQMTLRIRNVIKRLDPKPLDTMPVVPVADDVSPAIVSPMAHPLQASQVYTN
jgi:hypothetical protein